MGRLTRPPVVKVRAGADRRVRRSDTLAVEEPLEVRLDGSAFLVTMRTPGDDIDLVHGLLHGEGVITTASDVVRPLLRGDRRRRAADLQRARRQPVPGAAPTGPLRQVLVNSACGSAARTSIDQVVTARRHPTTTARAAPSRGCSRRRSGSASSSGRSTRPAACTPPG